MWTMIIDLFISEKFGLYFKNFIKRESLSYRYAFLKCEDDGYNI